MKRILIADASKASLVMTSEVFKDHFPGVQVVVARSSAECLEAAKSGEGLDAYVIDFDLPDRDGAWTAARIKKQTQTPVLITAFDRPEVHEIIEQELAPYDDCLSWLRKPVKAELVVAVAQRFCEGRYRTQRRLECAIPALAEVVVSTTLTRTIKETVKVAAGAAKATAKAPAKATAAAKGKAPTKSAASKATAKAAPASTTKTVTKTLTETVQSKVLVPALVRDTSLGGVKVELDFSGIASAGSKSDAAGSASWTTSAGEILTIQLPPVEVLESEQGPAAWSAWQKERLASRASNANAAGASNAAVAASATKGTKSTALSTLAAKTLAAPKKAATATKEPAFPVRGKVCWVETAGKTVSFGLELDNAAHARRVFDVALALHSKARASGRAPNAEAGLAGNVTTGASTLASLTRRANS